MSTQDNLDFHIAEQHFHNEEYDEAFEIYKRLADSGNVDSQVFVGWMYQNGFGVERNQNESFAWFQKAAKLGSAEAQFYLAKSYATIGDYSAAMEWYIESSRKSYPPALFRLGWIYDVGRGVKPDQNKAMAYYRQASQLGHVFATKGLGLLLIKGSNGTYQRLNGFFLILKSFFLGIKEAASDPHSEKLRD